MMTKDEQIKSLERRIEALERRFAEKDWYLPISTPECPCRRSQGPCRPFYDYPTYPPHRFPWGDVWC